MPVKRSRGERGSTCAWTRLRWGAREKLTVSPDPGGRLEGVNYESQAAHAYSHGNPGPGRGGRVGPGGRVERGETRRHPRRLLLRGGDGRRLGRGQRRRGRGRGPGGPRTGRPGGRERGRGGGGG